LAVSWWEQLDSNQ